MADKKIIFIAFAIEDEWARNMFTGQSVHPRTPFEFIDYSVKTPYDEEWRKSVRTRIKRSDGIVVLVSKNSLTSSGQQWEIACAKEERKRLKGVWIYREDKTSIDGVSTVTWSWDAIANFIDSL